MDLHLGDFFAGAFEIAIESLYFFLIAFESFSTTGPLQSYLFGVGKVSTFIQDVFLEFFVVLHSLGCEKVEEAVVRKPDVIIERLHKYLPFK